jgi:hypothetical protein
MDESRTLGRSPVLLTQSGDLTKVSHLREELQTLHERLTQLNHLLRDASDRRRFGPGLSISDATADEQRYLSELNNLMTRIRAVEGQLLLRKRCLH